MNNTVDNKIVKLRRDNSYLLTLLKEVQKYEPYSLLDDVITLKHILNTLRAQNLPFTKKEVFNTFTSIYKREFHGDKESYLKFLYIGASENKVFVGQTRSQPSKERTLPGNVEASEPVLGHYFSKDDEMVDPTNTNGVNAK